MICRSAPVLACLAALASAEVPPTSEKPERPPIPAVRPKSGEPIDDEATESYLSEKGRKIVEAGQTLKTWQQDLGEKRSVFPLAKPSSTASSLAEATKQIEAATVVIALYFVEKGSPDLRMETASGFIVSTDGAIVTARHVLDFSADDRKDDTPQGVLAMTREGRLLSISGVAACDPANDVVVLKTDAHGLPAVPLSATAPQGTTVGVLAHSDGRFYSLTTGVVSRLWTAHDDDGKPTTFLSITADFAGGASGGPVFDLTGSVVGVVNSTESIYFDDDGSKQTDLQMVVKNTTPASVVRALLGGK